MKQKGTRIEERERVQVEMYLTDGRLKINTENILNNRHDLVIKFKGANRQVEEHRERERSQVEMYLTDGRLKINTENSHINTHNLETTFKWTNRVTK